MDLVFNRHTRIAKFAHGQDVYMLLDAQLLELTRERMILSGIEREKDDLINKVEDFAQTWVCWFVKIGYPEFVIETASQLAVLQHSRQC